MSSQFSSSLKYYEENINAGKPFYMDADPLVDIVEYYVKAERYFEAEQCLRIARRLHPNNDQVKISFAYRLKAENKWDEAHKIIVKVADQSHRDVQLFYVEEYAAMGCPQHSEEVFKAALPTPFTDVDYDWYVDVAEIYIDYGYYERALSWLSKIPSGNSEEKLVCNLRCEVFIQQGKLTEAALAASAMIDLDPYDQLSWALLAEIRHKQEAFQEAIEAADYALAIEPKTRQALYIKILSLISLKKGEEALSVSQTAMYHFPEDYYPYLYAAEVLYDHKKFLDAYLLLHKAFKYSLPESPERSRILSGLAYCSIGLGHDDEAIEILQTSFIAGTTPTEVALQAAILFLEHKKESKAVQLLTPVSQDSQLDAIAYRRLVDILAQYRCFIPAKSIWHKLLSNLRDSSVEILPILAFSSREIKEQKFYIDYLTRAILLAPQHTMQLFREAFHNAPLEDYIELAYREIELWEVA